jgi:hypothetical protein
MVQQPMCDIVDKARAQKIVAHNNKLRKKLESLGWCFWDHWHVYGEGFELVFARADDPLWLRLTLKWERQFKWFPTFQIRGATRYHPTDKYMSPFIHMEVSGITERHLTKDLMNVYIENIETALKSQKTLP